LYLVDAKGERRDVSRAERLVLEVGHLKVDLCFVSSAPRVDGVIVSVSINKGSLTMGPGDGRRVLLRVK